MKSRQRGFSLVEIFIAILLVASVFFSLASVFPLSLQSLRKSQSGTVANNLARQYMEWWKQQSYSNPTGPGLVLPPTQTYTDPLPPGPLPAAPSPQQYGSLVPGGSEVVYTTIVQFTVPNDPQTGNPLANNVQIDVNVIWQAGGLSGVSGPGLSAGSNQVHYVGCVYNVATPW